MRLGLGPGVVVDDHRGEERQLVLAVPRRERADEPEGVVASLAEEEGFDFEVWDGVSLHREHLYFPDVEPVRMAKLACRTSALSGRLGLMATSMPR